MVTPALNLCGGIESYAMNYYRNMSSNIHIDFATHDIKDENYKKEIEDNGGQVFEFPKIGLKSLKKFLKMLDEFFKNNHYDIVHCNMANAAIFYFLYAKKYGIKVRILHSHQNNYADTLTHKIRNYPLIYLGKKYTTHNFACSKIAGDFLYKNAEYDVINNAIKLEKFKFNKNTRETIRRQEGIKNNEILLANIGRICKQKNQLFIIDIYNELYKINKNVRLLLIGHGDLREKIIERINIYNLQDNILFKESVNNVNEYLQAVDMLVMPSLYEGLPVIGVEAQAAGVPCVFSNTITQEAKILENTLYINLDESAKKWAEVINNSINKSIEERKDESELMTKKGYNIEVEAKKMEEKYIKLCLKEGE